MDDILTISSVRAKRTNDWAALIAMGILEATSVIECPST